MRTSIRIDPCLHKQDEHWITPSPSIRIDLSFFNLTKGRLRERTLSVSGFWMLNLGHQDDCLIVKDRCETLNQALSCFMIVFILLNWSNPAKLQIILIRNSSMLQMRSGGRRCCLFNTSYSWTEEDVQWKSSKDISIFFSAMCFVFFHVCCQVVFQLSD